jgi:plastocyanin
MRRYLWIIVGGILILGIGGGAFILKIRADQMRIVQQEEARRAAEQARVEPASTLTSPPTSQAEKLYPVTYDGATFSPRNVILKAGATVVFSSESHRMWIASDKHPDHAGFDGTTMDEHCDTTYRGDRPFDQCADGVEYQFTFEKRGTFEYHDHLNPDARGTVTVL